MVIVVTANSRYVRARGCVHATYAEDEHGHGCTQCNQTDLQVFVQKL